LPAKLDRIVDLTFERLQGNFWIEQSRRTNDLFDHERRVGRLNVEFSGGSPA
jgi:hypothetical protein